MLHCHSSILVILEGNFQPAKQDNQKNHRTLAAEPAHIAHNVPVVTRSMFCGEGSNQHKIKNKVPKVCSVAFFWLFGGCFFWLSDSSKVGSLSLDLVFSYGLFLFDIKLALTLLKFLRESHVFHWVIAMTWLLYLCLLKSALLGANFL